MQEVTVKRDQLLARLRENREEHRAKYELAVDRYRDLAVQQFEKNIAEIKRGGVIRRGLSLPVPEDHTDDYDTAIQMLEWSVADEVELSYHEFRQYVEDEWGWKQSFTSNTVAYASGDVHI